MASAWKGLGFGFGLGLGLGLVLGLANPKPDPKYDGVGLVGVRVRVRVRVSGLEGLAALLVGRGARRPRREADVALHARLRVRVRVRGRVRGRVRVRVRVAVRVRVSRCRAAMLAWMGNGGEMGGFGGGYLEHPRQWLGTQWAGLVLGVGRASQSRQARPGEAQEPSWGTAKGGALTMLPRLGRSARRRRSAPTPRARPGRRRAGRSAARARARVRGAPHALRYALCGRAPAPSASQSP
eukprot:scaffold9156_cov57-Phaeocystis_antarctica.AAC.2